MGKRTALHQRHLDAGARMVDFAGWDMPLHYGSQLDEHLRVRSGAGVFDVSHMTIVDAAGADAKGWLRRLLANDVARLDSPGDALYSAMLNEEGGVVDDLIVYRMDSGYRLVLNCATREKDLAWMAARSGGFSVSLAERPDLAMLAVHGPQAIDRFARTLPPEHAAAVRALGNFQGTALNGDRFVARTGYTGERGLEAMLPAGDAGACWDRLLAEGVAPVGLGARDTLRLEAGMNLYGSEMDETVSPLAANMGRTIAWDPPGRDFIGRAAAAAHREEQAAGRLPRLAGLALEGRGVLRAGQKAMTDAGDGVVTSGGFSPTLKHSIALARIPSRGRSCRVDIRGAPTPVRIVKPGFVRFGRKVFE